MTFNQEAQRSIQQFGKLGVNLKSLCFAPKLKHQLCWHSSFLRPRCHQFLNFCNLSNKLNIITPFTLKLEFLSWSSKFSRLVVSLLLLPLSSAPCPPTCSCIWRRWFDKFNPEEHKVQLETFIESNPSTPSPSKISTTLEFFYHAAYLVKVWSQNAKPLFEVEARWWWLSSFDQQPLSDINRLKDYETPSKVSSQHIFWPKKAPLIYFRQLMRNKWTLSLIIRS